MSHTKTVTCGLPCPLISRPLVSRPLVSRPLISTLLASTLLVSTLLVSSLLVSSLLICRPSSAQAIAEHDGDAHWDPNFETYTFQRVVALQLDENEAFLAGPFSVDGRENLPAVVRMRPGSSTVETLLDAASGGWFTSLALADSNLYAGGSFDFGGGKHNIAAWNRADGSWQSLASGLDQPVRDLALNAGDSLYALTNFTLQQRAPWLVKVHLWNGSGWISLGEEFEGSVYDMAVNGQDVYVSLNRRVDGEVVDEIKHWDGSEWTTLAVTDGVVYALATDESGRLYAGGRFDAVGGVVAHGVAAWNGATWSPVGELSKFERVLALVAKDGRLFAGGDLETFGSLANLMVWDGASWSPADSGTSGDIDRLSVSDGSVAAAGSFDVAGSVVAHNAAVYDIDLGEWSAMKTADAGGIRGVVNALAFGENGEVYAGGRFSTAGGAIARNVAVWDGESWSPLGEGLHWEVGELQVYEGTLFAGAERHTLADTALALASWNRTQGSWQSVEPDFPDVAVHSTSALASANGRLYVATRLSKPSGETVAQLLSWDGVVWSIIGDSVIVTELAVDEAGILYAGGYFDAIGNTQAKNIAKWDGNDWTSLGEGLEPEVSALAAAGGNVYAAAYGPDLHIFSGETGSWSQTRSLIQAPSNCTSAIHALAARGDTVFAGGGGGACTTEGGDDSSVQTLARWTPEGWSLPGSGIKNHIVYALVMNQDDLFAGGWIDRAGGRSSMNIAHWNEVQHLPAEPPSPIEQFTLEQSYPNPASTHTTIAFTLTRPSRQVTLVVYDVLGRRVAEFDDGSKAAGSHSVEVDARALPAGTYFYRLSTDGREQIRRMVVAR